MTEVTIYYNKNSIRGFTICGHSNYDDVGYDILCAAISMLATTTINSIINIARLSENDIIKCKVDDSVPFMGIIISDTLSNRKKHDAQLLFKNLIYGLKQLASEPSYEQFISISYRRWNDD
ncbi:MAG: ribosomal-processing cysteine protease Prp [Tissierellia bacterium]|nr:ribosomal-processing cysteine protease Prp [Tissierellia bacterium]